MKKIHTNEGTVFNKIVGDEQKAMYYNEKLNNLIIVTTDTKEDEALNIISMVAEAYQNGSVSYEDALGAVDNDLADEDFNDTIEDAIGFIVGDRWDELCLAAEYVPNTTILVHKPYHTTTDFTVNYDLNPRPLLDKPIANVIEIFNLLVPNNTDEDEIMVAASWKIVEIIGGQAYKYGDAPDELLEQKLEQLN